MSRVGLPEKRENYRDVTCWMFNGWRPPLRTPYSGMFDSTHRCHDTQAVDGVSTKFAISILKSATKLRHGARVWPKSQPKL
jgi:hypothetical protein